jgi:hypothetical protein
VFEEFQWTLKTSSPVDEDRCLTVHRIAGRFRHTGIETDSTPRLARRAAGLDSAP